MIITSLPISYRVNRPHRIMISPYVVSLIARMTGVKAFFPINMISLREEGWDSLDEGEESYKSMLESLGYFKNKDAVISDASPALIYHSQQCVKKAVSEGVCEFRTEDISICPCGRVEILTRLIGDLAKRNQLHLITDKGGKYFCKICTHELQEKRREVLMYQHGASVRHSVWPSIYNNSLGGALDSLEKKSYLVSRSLLNRKYKVSITNDLCIDPDFHSAIYLRYLSENEGDTEVVVTVGANHLYRGIRATAIANNLGLPIDFRLIVHPMFDFETGNSMLEQSMSSKEYLRRLGGKAELKLFQATMLQSGRSESCCNIGDLSLLKKTIPSLMKYGGVVDTVSLDEALSLLNRNKLLVVLKKVRKNKSLSKSEKCLISTML